MSDVFGFGKSQLVVGLDIGTSAVKAVELKAVGKTLRVTAFASEPVPPDSIVDGAIIDGGAVADAIRRLFENKAFKTKEGAPSLGGHAVIVSDVSIGTGTNKVTRAAGTSISAVTQEAPVNRIADLNPNDIENIDI